MVVLIVVHKIGRRLFLYVKIQKNIYLMYAISLFQGMVFYASVATLYRQARGISVFQITLIESISLLLCLFMEIPWGIIADQIGYRKAMIFCCLLYVVSKIIFWQADDFAMFLLERILLSIVFAGMSGVDTSILYLSCKSEKSQHAFAIYDMLGTLGLLFSAFIFSVFVKTDYKLAGELTVISYGIAAILSFGLTEVKQEKETYTGQEKVSVSKETEMKKVLAQIMKNKYLLLFLVSVALISETHQTITVFLNQLQYKRCGMSVSVIGYIYMMITIAGLCGAYSAQLTEEIGIRRLGLILYTAAIMACILLSITSNAFLSAGAVLVLRLANSFFQPLQMEMQNRQITVADRATALSVNAMIIDSIGVGTNILFGALAEINLVVAFLFGAGICFLGLILFLICQPYMLSNIRHSSKLPVDNFTPDELK